MSAGEYLTLTMQSLLTVDTILAVGVVAWLQLEQVRVAAILPSRRIWAEVKWCVLWLFAAAVGAPLLVLVAWRPVEVIFLALVPSGVPGWWSWLTAASIPCVIALWAVSRGDRLWREVLQVRYEAGVGGVIIIERPPSAEYPTDGYPAADVPLSAHAPRSGMVEP